MKTDGSPKLDAMRSLSRLSKLCLHLPQIVSNQLIPTPETTIVLSVGAGSAIIPS